AENYAAGVDVPELDVRDGYSRWSTTYDLPGNPLVAVEQPLVWGLLDDATPGRALDAACGTGRHARRLAELGHEVVGVDATDAMLEEARKKAPAADFRQGDLFDLPLETATFDLAVCALALDHAGELRRPLTELTRVVRPGGKVIVSDI